MSTPPAAPDSASAWAPFASSGFRIVWSVAFSVAMCSAMNDVAAGWLMTSMTASPLMVALIQTAATLPMFIFGLPAGATADLVDRRKFLIFNQLWLTAVALVACAALWADAMNAWVLLAVTFCGGLGVAMRFPGVSGTLPETVTRAQLPQALALNSVALNGARVIGPGVAGVLIASVGTTAVYVTNAVVAVSGCIALLRWRRLAPAQPPPATSLARAMLEGVRHVRHSRELRAVLGRTMMFFVHGIIGMALLPLVAHRLDPGNPRALSVLFGAFGAGAVFVCIVVLPRLRLVMSPEKRLRNGSLVLGAALLVLSVSPWLWLSAPALFCAGVAWTGVGNTLTTQAQINLPPHMHARVASIYQGFMMGSSAVGATLWGWLASHVDLATTYQIAAVSLGSLAVLTYHPDAMRGAGR